MYIHVFDNPCIHLWWVMGFISTKATVACLTLSMVMVHGCGLVVHFVEHGHGSVGPRLAIFGISLNFLWEQLSCFGMSDSLLFSLGSKLYNPFACNLVFPSQYPSSSWKWMTLFWFIMPHINVLLRINFVFTGFDEPLGIKYLKDTCLDFINRNFGSVIINSEEFTNRAITITHNVGTNLEDVFSPCK